MNHYDQARRLIGELAARGLQATHATADSRVVRPGDVFLAYPGLRGDGRRHIGDAIARGAAAVLWEREGYVWDDVHAITNLSCDGLQALAGELASQIYRTPSRQLRLVGVTGTNGKTSTTQWLARAYAALHQPCGVIGTLGAGFPEQELVATENTTPDAVSLQTLLFDFVAAGAKAAAIEVSSIGLDQGRLGGAVFDTAVFTNLTRDHLDYHHTMEAYAQAKAKLFSWLKLRAVVINLDDAVGMELAADCAERLPLTIGYTLGESLEHLPSGLRVLAANVRDTSTGMNLDVLWAGQRNEFKVGLVGRFNAANLLAVIGSLLAGGISFDDACDAVSGLTPLPGRMQIIGGVMEPLVVVDYAHTPDALEQALRALQPTARGRGGRLICVFGCGGGRDPGKRPLMGATATRLADSVIVTSDNPRGEDSAAIISAILAGADPSATSMADRAAAIEGALLHADADDVILIAGKGHEPYQEIAGVRHPFSDTEHARAALRLRAKTGGRA